MSTFSQKYQLNYEESIKQFEVAEQFYKQQNYQKALLHLEQSLRYNPPYPMIYQRCSMCYFHQNQYDIALKQATFAINLWNDQEIEANSNEFYDYTMTQYIKSQIYQKLGRIDEHNKEIKQVYQNVLQSPNLFNQEFRNQLQTILSQNQQVRSPSQVRLEEINNHLQKNNNLQIVHRSKEDRMKEAKDVVEFMENSQQNKFLQQEGMPVHIITMKWFRVWKKYVCFDEVCKSFQKNDQDEENDQKEFNQNEEEELKYPGSIIQNDILQESDMLIDPDQTKNYCNYVLKTDLRENVDFIIVSHQTWKYLYQKYGGQEIKRLIISLNDETDVTQVEISLKKVNILQLPPISKSQSLDDCQLQTLYLSRKETIKDLKEKIARIYRTNSNIRQNLVNQNNCKLWKLDSNITMDEIINQVSQNFQQPIKIKAKKLQENMSLDECEFLDNDKIIIEYKISNDWIFISEEDIATNMLNRCGNCLNNNIQLYFCQCRQIKYCGQECQKLHRKEHKELCNKISEEIQFKNNLMKKLNVSTNKKFTKQSKFGITGLQNLGNTCFMNSALQCMSNVTELSEYFIHNEFVKDLNIANPIGTGGFLASVYGELIKDLWCGRDDYISPWTFKRVIEKFAPQFMGYSQQDSQELLSYLLDGLHEDLNRVKNKPVVENKDSDNRPDSIVSKESWSNYLKRNNSFIVSLMAGQYKSTLVCPDCNRISITFDPFLSLSLPIPNKEQLNIKLYFIPKDCREVPIEIKLSCRIDASAQELMKQLSKHLNIQEKFLKLFLIKDHKIVDSLESFRTAKQLREHQGIIFVYQIYDDKIDLPILSNEKQCFFIEIEVSMSSLNKKGNVEVRDISFTRLLRIPKNTTFKQINHEIFKYFRYYLNNALTSDKNLENQYKKSILNLKDISSEQINKEYQYFFETQELPVPYQVMVINDDSENGELKNTDEKLNVDFQEEEQFQLRLQVLFSGNIKEEILRLNKCQQDSNQQNSFKDNQNFTLNDCLDLFIREEILDKENEWYCNKCKEHKQASKKMEIFKAPKILILHLKRFKTTRVSSIGTFYFTSGSQKITNFVQFPLKGFDLSQYILSQNEQNNQEEKPIYDLFGIINHFGGLGGGHYTAYCQNNYDNKWYDYNDSNVTEQDPDQLISPAAYVLFYRRREQKQQNNMNSHF